MHDYEETAAVQETARERSPRATSEGATPNKLPDTRDRAVEQSGERRSTPTEGITGHRRQKALRYP